MTRLSLSALLLGAGVAGCSALTPFSTSPRGLALNEPNPGTRVAVCYNTFKTPPEKLQQMAQAQCGEKTVAERIDTDYRLDDCPLLTPGRATFVCKPEK
jgi:hypothetical protein